MDGQKPIHYDEQGVVWPCELWVQLEAKREAAEREEKRRNGRMTIIVAVVGAFVSLAAAVAAFGSLREAHLTRVDDERPFVAVDVQKESVVTAEFGSNQNVLYVEVASFGKTAARHIYGECQVFHKPLSDRPKFIEMGKDFENTYLLPSRTYAVTCPYIITGTDSNSSTDPMTILGFVRYTDGDSADGKYATPFCYDVGTLRGKLTIIPCFTENNGLPALK